MAGGRAVQKKRHCIFVTSVKELLHLVVSNKHLPQAIAVSPDRQIGVTSRTL